MWEVFIKPGRPMTSAGLGKEVVVQEARGVGQWDDGRATDTSGSPSCASLPPLFTDLHKDLVLWRKKKSSSTYSSPGLLIVSMMLVRYVFGSSEESCPAEGAGCWAAVGILEGLATPRRHPDLVQKYQVLTKVRRIGEKGNDKDLCGSIIS